MSQEDIQFSREVQRARDTLVNQFIDHPDVHHIDIGLKMEQSTGVENVVIRIHVSERWVKSKKEERIAFPEQVNGVPVVVILGGDYRPEIDF